MVVEMNPIAPALALVRRIDIGAIISRQALIDVTDLHIIPIENPTPMRTPGILWNRNHQPTAAAKSFAVILRNAVVGTPMASVGRHGDDGQRLAVRVWARLARPKIGAGGSEVKRRLASHCSIGPKVATTLPHLSISSRMKVPNSWRVPVSGS